MAENSRVRNTAATGIDLAKHSLHPLLIETAARAGNRRRLAAILWLRPARAEDLLLQSGEAPIFT